MSDALTVRQAILPEIRRIAILCTLLILLLAGTAMFILTDPVLASRFAFSRTAITLHERYAGQEVDWDVMIKQAYAALFEPLDRYSGPIREAQFQRMDEEVDGSYSGIGVSVLPDSGSLLIVGVREGGPAAGARLENGDRIVQVDTTRLTVATVDQSIDLLRGKEGTKVQVGVRRRANADTVMVELTRKKLPLIHVPYAGFASDGIGYVRLTDFDPGAAAEVQEKIVELQAVSAGKMTGFILDLRSNPGGLLDEAIKLADLFLPSDSLIVGTSARSRWRSDEWHATGGDILNALPMLVLVDRNTASAAEIVSGALNQNGRAQLVGDTTYGKGLVQGFRRFPDGSGVKLTQARYYLRGHIYLNDFDSTLTEIGRGIIPNILTPGLTADSYTEWIELGGTLEQFASKHAEELTRASRGGFLPGTEWQSRFATYLDSTGQHYLSVSTRRLQLLTSLAAMDESGHESKGYLQSLHEKFVQLTALSEKDDQQRAIGHEFYLSYRLAQIAWERKDGSDSVYKEVIVPFHPVIRRAVELLQSAPIAHS